ncbi:YvrJ-like protein [Halanaerobium saccharolyticum]|uniref:YvrJ-like protein n=1 Tax=Halanaerobium saccharolyticum TaxID=43595 RepID=A0A4R7Z7J0_9FIRM|nr:YvrJ family protein [Halanaerobium saccharolyticum]RAK12541.1 YvrJ-like protein [Halanaerobium saccharolyticum]TDW06467.1 YvrJ-like protein [Halanaerobium saccharolyticum]TDX61715.1 YvrJ-like protein [Halanaerobium saccharolyticum]
MEQLFNLISTYGFPMVLSIYLLIRLETLIRGLKESIDTLIILSNVESAELRRLKKEKEL